MTDNDWKILAKHGVTPGKLTVRGNLDLYNTALTELPEGLTVNGYLDLYNTALTELPEGLTVNGYMDLYNTAITELPEGLTVNGYMDLYNTAITALYECERGYKLVRLGDIYHCGCRRFTAAEAIAHWTDPQYPKPERGEAFANAVRAEEMRREREGEQ